MLSYIMAMIMFFSKKMHRFIPHSLKTDVSRALTEYLPWLTNSPDLNLIEKLWGKLAREVYKNEKHYDSVNDLKHSIMPEWNSIP
jgi:transposase